LSNVEIEELKAELASQRKAFEEQMEKAKKEYPLVALAFSLQQATIATMAYTAEPIVAYPIVSYIPTYAKYKLLLEQLHALTGEPPVIGAAICFDEYIRCLHQSRRVPLEMVDCQDKYQKCLRRR